ncbi:pyocin knob domain-containing protein [Paenibacillus sp. FSL R10-2778]|uniref:pyocin knob domain-containing protein n=1 Tax=Paenibacillus sp. FSL R10-2778 TaxID=2954659 RepID=UPI0031598142
MAFNEKLPEWQEPGIEPPESKRKTGWQINDKPPAAWLNWYFNRVYKVFQEIRSKFDTHTEDNNIHVTAAKQTAWNVKETPEGAQTKADAAREAAKAASIPLAQKGAASGVALLEANKLMVADGTVLSSRITERVLGFSFSNSVANQRIDLFTTGALSGYIEVTVTASWNAVNAAGKMTKRFNVVAAAATTLNYQSTQYPEVTGLINQHISISDISWDATNSRWKISIEARHAPGAAIAFAVSVKHASPTAPPTWNLSAVYSGAAPTALPVAVQTIPDDTVLQSGQEFQKYKLTDNAGKVIRLAPSTDLNTVNRNGQYDGYPLINAPGNNTGAWFFIEVFSHSQNPNTIFFQRATTFATVPRSYIRECYNSVWGEWIEDENASRKDIPGGYLGLDSARLVAYNGDILNGRSARVVLVPAPFTNVKNQRFDVLITGTKIHGYMDVTLSAGWSGGNGGGKITKRFNIITSAGGTIDYQVTQYTDVTGNLPNMMAISDIVYDSALAKWKFTVEAIAANGNTPTVKIEAGSGTGVPIPTFSLSAIYAGGFSDQLPKPVQVLPDDAVMFSGREFQKHPLTSSIGRNILLNNGTDLDTIIENGFYNGSNLVNAPTTYTDRWYYVEVQRHTTGDSYVLQRATQLAGSISGERHVRYERIKKMTWGPWIEIEGSDRKNVANGYAGLDNNGFVSANNLPYGGVVNLLGDSGRFMGIDGDPRSLQITTSFANNSFLSPWNGTTVSSGGKFIHDNTTNGGTAGALTEDVTSLLTAMSLGGSRYGTEFYIASYTMGSGTANAGNVAGTYLMTVNSNFPATGVGKAYTVSFWVRVKTGTTISIPRDGRLSKNGVSTSANYISLTPADGWVHIEKTVHASNGYYNAAPGIAATAGSVVQIAMPVVVAGAIGVGVHTSPVMGSSLGFVPLPATSYTAADILLKLLTVDGVGSGLDADLHAGKNMGEIANGTLTYAGLTKGTAPALTASIAGGVITSLIAGDRISFKAHAATTGPVTLNVNGLGAKSIKKPNGNNPPLALGGVYTVVYDGTAFILQGEGGEYGTATAAEVLAGKTIGTENGLVNGTMPDNRSVAKDAAGATLSVYDLYLNTPEGYYNTTSSIRVREDNLADPSIWRSDRTMFGKQGTMPVITSGEDPALSVGKWGDGSLAVYPREGYRKGGSGAGEIKVTTAQLRSVEGDLAPANIRSGVEVFGVTGTLVERMYAEGYAGSVGGGDGIFRVSGLAFSPRIVRFTYFRASTQSTFVFFASDITMWSYTEFSGTNPYGNVVSSGAMLSPNLWGSNAFCSSLPYNPDLVNISWSAWR